MSPAPVSVPTRPIPANEMHRIDLVYRREDGRLCGGALRQHKWRVDVQEYSIGRYLVAGGGDGLAMTNWTELGFQKKRQGSGMDAVDLLGGSVTESTSDAWALSSEYHSEKKTKLCSILRIDQVTGANNSSVQSRLR